MEEQNENFIENFRLELGMYIILKTHLCEVTQVRLGTCGKHGKQKILIAGIGVFNGNKYEDIFIAHGEFTQLIVPTLTNYLVTNLDGNILHAFDEKYNNEIQIDLASNNLCDKILEHMANMKACNVKILSYKNLHKIVEVE